MICTQCPSHSTDMIDCLQSWVMVYEERVVTSLDWFGLSYDNPRVATAVCPWKLSKAVNELVHVDNMRIGCVKKYAAVAAQRGVNLSVALFARIL